MILLHLIKHQWKQARRSPVWQKNIAVNIIMGFFFTIVLLEFVVLSIYVADKWREIITTGEPITTFHQVMAWYFSGMLVTRFFMQKLPAMEARPYQHLPLSKSTLIHYILLRGSFGWFNLLTYILIIPFSIFQIGPFYGTGMAWLWLGAMMVMDLTVNYTVFYFKKQMSVRFKLVAAFLIVLVLMGLADYFGWFSYSLLLAKVFDYLLLKPATILLFIVLAAAVYRLNFGFLRQGLYLEAYQTATDRTYAAGNIRYLDNKGIVGQLMAVDIKLQLRNKRTRSMLMLAPVFLAYGLLFYPSGQYGTDGGFVVFIGMFTTSVIAINYLQYAFAYEGAFFDFIRSSGVNMANMVKAKMNLATLSIGLSFILTTPYVFFGYDVLFIHAACTLFSMGFIVPALLFFATYNKKTMVLSRGSAFNYQGVGAAHFFAMIPVFVLPVMIYLPFKWLGYPHTGMIALASAGFLGLLLRPIAIKLILENLEEKKYLMLEGFRQKF